MPNPNDFKNFLLLFLLSSIGRFFPCEKSVNVWYLILQIKTNKKRPVNPAVFYYLYSNFTSFPFPAFLRPYRPYLALVLLFLAGQ